MTNKLENKLKCACGGTYKLAYIWYVNEPEKAHPFKCNACGSETFLSEEENKEFLRNERKNTWIKCSERLPDNEERVLVYDAQLKLPMIMIFDDGEWRYDLEMELFCSDYSCITH